MYFKFLTTPILFFLIVLFCPVAPVSANSFGVNLYGASYHINDRHNSRGFKRKFNEFNEGIGLRASFGTDSAAVTLFLEGGTFQDTFEKQAKYMSLGFQIRVIYQLRIGLNAAIYTTKSIRNGNPFFAPIPIVSYTVSFITLNAVYMPKYKDRNPWHTIGAYLTINLFKGEPTR